MQLIFLVVFGKDTYTLTSTLLNLTYEAFQKGYQEVFEKANDLWRTI